MNNMRYGNFNVLLFLRNWCLINVISLFYQGGHRSVNLLRKISVFSYKKIRLNKWRDLF